jgi:LysM repeat protein
MNQKTLHSSIRAGLIASGIAFVSLLFAGALAGLSVQAAPLPQLTPFPTPTPGADGRILYIVQPNDTLWRISAITGVSLDTLRMLNNLGSDDIIAPGDILLIGLAGPESATAIPEAIPTSELVEPTTPARQGTGNLCVILYNDLNGDAMRQEEEPWILDGQISINDRSGNVSNTVETEPLFDEDGEIAYACFQDLPEADYNITAAIPEGFNPTTVLSRSLKLMGGEETYLSFGAQANSELIAETAIIPDAPRKSPLLGILGVALLLVGVGLGIYVGLLSRIR